LKLHRKPLVIVVEVGDPGASSSSHSEVPRVCSAAAAARMKNPIGQGVDNLSEIVRQAAAIHHDYQLDGGALQTHTLKCCGELSPSDGRHDDCYERWHNSHRTMWSVTSRRVGSS
jgi:hypothetical protein